MPTFTPSARLLIVVFLTSFCLMLLFGDHNFYLVDDRTGQVKLKHVSTFSEKILPSALLAGLSTAVAIGLNWLLQRGGDKPPN